MRPLDEIKTDWRKAIKELEKAELEYSKFLTKPLESDEKPDPISLAEMKAASDKLMVARGKERKYLMEYLEQKSKSLFEPFLK